MTRKTLICFGDEDQARAVLLGSFLRGRNQTAMLINRSAPPVDKARSALQVAAEEADMILLVVEPDSMQLDPLALYTVGLANALGKPVFAITRTERMHWPPDVLAQLDGTRPWPDEVLRNSERRQPIVASLRKPDLVPA